MTTKRYWISVKITALLCSAVIFFGCSSDHAGKVQVEAVSIRLPRGWGYEIKSGDKVYIRQEIIPALQGNRVFESEADALKVGNFVVQKLSLGRGPSVSIHELDSLHIR